MNSKKIKCCPTAIIYYAYDILYGWTCYITDNRYDDYPLNEGRGLLVHYDSVNGFKLNKINATFEEIQNMEQSLSEKIELFINKFT